MPRFKECRKRPDGVAPSRRSLIAGLVGLAVGTGSGQAGATALARPVAPLPRKRILARHLHTGEKIDVAYVEGGRYVPRALAMLDHFLRDHRDGTVHPIDPRLFDFLHEVTVGLGTRGAVEIVCGYRSEHSNALLRAASSGVAKKSLHMQGQAMDIRIPGRSVDEIARVALGVGNGGVGRYTRSDFVHIDTGRVRTWGS